MQIHTNEVLPLTGAHNVNSGIQAAARNTVPRGDVDVEQLEVAQPITATHTNYAQAASASVDDGVDEDEDDNIIESFRDSLKQFPLVSIEHRLVIRLDVTDGQFVDLPSNTSNDLTTVETSGNVEINFLSPLKFTSTGPVGFLRQPLIDTLRLLDDNNSTPHRLIADGDSVNALNRMQDKFESNVERIVFGRFGSEDFVAELDTDGEGSDDGDDNDGESSDTSEEDFEDFEDFDEGNDDTSSDRNIDDYEGETNSLYASDFINVDGWRSTSVDNDGNLVVNHTVVLNVKDSELYDADDIAIKLKNYETKIRGILKKFELRSVPVLIVAVFDTGSVVDPSVQDLIYAMTQDIDESDPEAKNYDYSFVSHADVMEASLLKGSIMDAIDPNTDTTDFDLLVEFYPNDAVSAKKFLSPSQFAFVKHLEYDPSWDDKKSKAE